MTHETLHIETHIVYTAAQAEQLKSTGVWVKPLTGACNYCDTPVCYVADRFIPFGLVLNGEDDWQLCMSCSAPLHHRQKL